MVLFARDLKFSLDLFLCQRLHPTEHGKKNFQLHDLVVLHLLVNEMFLRLCETECFCEAF